VVLKPSKSAINAAPNSPILSVALGSAVTKRTALLSYDLSLRELFKSLNYNLYVLWNVHGLNLRLVVLDYCRISVEKATSGRRLRRSTESRPGTALGWELDL